MSEPTIQVDYKDGEPNRIEYFHTTLGLMRFHPLDRNRSVWCVDEEWHNLPAKSLKDGYDKFVTESDVCDAVESLPFVDGLTLVRG